MNLSDNCQNCSSSDQISIAGKTFCANCGTAAASASGNEGVVGGAAPSHSSNNLQPSIGMAPSTDVSSSSPTSTASTNGDDIVSSLTASLSGKPAEPTTATTKSPDTNTPPSTNSQSTTPWVMDTPAATTPPATPPTPTPEPTTAPVSSSINKFTPSANITDLRPVANNPANTLVPQTPSVAVPQTSNPAVDSMTQSSSNTPDNLPDTHTQSSELASLDSKDEHVFSDDQFNLLANSDNERPAAVQELSTKPSTPPVVVPMDTIRSVATPTLAPTQVTTFTASPQTPSPPAQAPVAQPLTQPVLNPDSINTVAASASTTTPGVIEPQSNTLTENPSTGLPGVPDEPMPVAKKKSSLGKKSAKAATVTLTMAGLLLLGAYVWQVNYPNLALKVASSKAGINASMPGYLPNGWQVSNNISSGPGTISYQIGSADGKASATVNESKTDWDSQALAENYVSNKSDKYLSLQAAGLTIYVYGNQASWVNNGTWYRIEGDNTNLSQDQLIRMATSL